MTDVAYAAQGVGVDGTNDYTGDFDEANIAGTMHAFHSVVHILFVIPEAVGSINVDNAAILVQLQKLGRVHTIVQTDALNYPHFQEYNVIVLGQNTTAWTTSNLAHVKESVGHVICVDDVAADFLQMGTNGGDAASKTVLVAINQIEATMLGIGSHGFVGLAVGNNTIAASGVTFNTLDMSDADVTETFYATEAVADNTDVLIGIIYKEQPDGAAGVGVDGAEVAGTRMFYGPGFAFNSLNTLGQELFAIMVEMGVHAGTTGAKITLAGDIGQLQTKMFGNQASEFNNGNPMVEYLSGRNSSGTRLPVGKSIYDLLGTAYVDGGGAFNLVSIADDLKRLAQFLVDGTDGGEAGNILPTGLSLFDVVRDKLGAKVTRAAADVLNGATVNLFTVATGRIMLMHFEGEVTGAAVDASNSNVKIVSNPTVGTDLDLCAVLDVISDELGTIYTLAGVLATALQGGSGGGAPGMSASGLVIPEGTIDIQSTVDVGTGGAQVKFEAWYIPLDSGATLASA